MTNETNGDFMLDDTLDDLADLPQQKPFPAGAHNVSLVVRTMEDKPGVYLVDMTYKEPVEMADASEEAPKPGDKSVVFIHTRKKDGTANVIGQGQLKIVLLPLAQLFETKSVAGIIEQSGKGVDCCVVVAVRKDKNGQYDDSQNIKAVQVI